MYNISPTIIGYFPTPVLTIQRKMYVIAQNTYLMNMEYPDKEIFNYIDIIANLLIYRVMRNRHSC